MHPASGLVTWTPSAAQVGIHHVALLANDGQGGETSQTFDLQVAVPINNDPPVITSTPKTSIRLGDTYFYQVTASDPNNDVIQISLLQFPKRDER